MEGRIFLEFLVKQGGKIPIAKAPNILTPVMDALREVNAVGMLHRSTLLIERENVDAKVGMARAASAENAERLIRR
jgi:hypothetical protein